MTPQDFIEIWKSSTAKERQEAQLCEQMGVCCNEGQLRDLSSMLYKAAKASEREEVDDSA